jgi:hypothetical protein
MANDLVDPTAVTALGVTVALAIRVLARRAAEIMVGLCCRLSSLFMKSTSFCHVEHIVTMHETTK